jgi:tetratricopeptide (TPR) repeat protein
MEIVNKHSITWSSILVSLLLFSFTIPDFQEVQQKPSRQAALEAFSNGDYDKAFREFQILLQAYSRDPLYKYYSGVCLVKMNTEPEKASEFLREALNGSLDIKSIPDDSWFYLGRAQQMAGRFPDAIDSFNNFEEKAEKKRARDLNVSEYIRECKERNTGPVQKIAPGPPVAEKAEVQTPVKPVPQKIEVPVAYDKVLSDAMKYQVKADSLNSLNADYRKEYDKLAPSQKQAAKLKISEMESLSYEYQRMADEKFGNANVRPPEKKTDISQTILPEPVRRNEIFSLFNVETDPGRLRDLKVLIDPEIPAGLVYRIQIGVFSRQMESSFFKGISPVAGFRIPGTTSTKYFAGQFRKIADASQAVVTVRQMGFKDSFVTAVLDGKAVSLERAALLENEWGQKPLMETVQLLKTGEAETSTLVFRVEVTRLVKQLSEDSSEAYRKMAGNRGLEIIKAEDGTFVYLIGKFITFDSADEYAGLLKRNGYRDAKVTAYLGNKEIALETAKQLFEKEP